MNAKTKTIVVTLFAASAGFLSACSTKGGRTKIVAAVVNDPCNDHATAQACDADKTGGCSWIALGIPCADGAECRSGICVTPDPCGQITDRAACQADDRCAWSAVLANAEAILCPAGRDCANDGFCHGRDLTGGGCACVQPVACPPNTVCPAVQCDCGGTGSSGGGTCTCACPDCAPGTSCAPCDCNCGSGGGSTGSGGTGCGQSTCTCACPVCPPNTACAPCDCACGAGAVGVAGTGTASGGNTSSGGSQSSPTCACPVCPPNTACAPCDCPPPTPGTNPPPSSDPCTGHSDSQSCVADTVDRCTWYALGIPCVDGQECRSGVCQQQPASTTDPCAAHTDPVSCAAETGAACGWIALGIACVTDPCPPSGRCVEMKPVPGGGSGGCGCACPACVSGEACPPCTCSCCPE